MYQGSYYTDEEKLTPPINYDGTAFSGEEKSTDAPFVSASAAPTDTSAASAAFGLPFLSSIFGGTGLRMPKIGTEEILILVTAGLLLFSKGGDRECAIILLILLFIN